LSALTFLALTRAQDLCSEFATACRDDHYIAKIVCNGQLCKCLLPSGEEAGEEDGKKCPTDTADLTDHAVNSTQCEKKCVDYAGGTCQYFRWEQDSVTDTHCSLMDNTQCQDFLQCEGEDHCVSKQPGCTDEPEPTTGTCLAGSTFSHEHGAVHWTCHNRFHPDEYVSIYNSDEIKPGTICWTAHRCINFDKDSNDNKGGIGYRNLVAMCGSEDNTNGAWVPYQETSNAITDAIEEEKLLDQTCLPSTDLELDATKLVEVGVSFICTELDSDHYDTESKKDKIILKQYNHCILLCNFHTVMTIEPKVAGDGNDDPKWWMYLADGTEKEVKPDDVKCWD